MQCARLHKHKDANLKEAKITKMQQQKCSNSDADMMRIEAQKMIMI